MLNFIEVRDHRLMHRLNNWRAPRWIRIWMICASKAGDGWLWYALAIGILLFGGTERFPALGAWLISSVSGTGIFWAVKRTTGRKRPCAIAEHCWAKLLPPDQFSFPSGHSINAFAAAVSFGLFYPELLPALLFCAGSVAISRIVLGMHFLSDVIAGSALGTALGYIGYAIYS